MGLFDSLQFDPQNYDGGIQGLLSRLQQGAQYQNNPGQFPNTPQPQPDQAQIPQNAQPTAGQLPPQQPMQIPQYLQGDSSNLNAGFQGFANSSGLLPALGNLFQGLATGTRTDPAGMQQQQARATFQALVSSGVPPSHAMAAALNPDILKTIAPAYFDTKPTLQETGTDPITGQKSFSQYRPAQGTLTPIGGAGNSAQGGASGFLAQGVSNIDRSLTGDDYLKQFGPEVQAAVKSYIAGDVMPTGNPRQQAIAQQAKTIAQKYGADLGIPVSDALYSQKRMYRSQLGSNTPNSAGGQAKAFNQGIEHMGALADTLEKLDNSNGLGIPMVASAINTMRQGLSTEQSGIADKAAAIGQTLAGEVGKLFSGSSGGGVHERELTRERFNTVRSKPQLAAALEATLEVMKGGLTALEQRRDEVLGQNSDVRFVNPETEKQIAKIQDVIARLKSGASPSASAPNAPAVGAVQQGHKFLGGNPADKNSWQKIN